MPPKSIDSVFASTRFSGAILSRSADVSPSLPPRTPTFSRSSIPLQYISLSDYAPASGCYTSAKPSHFGCALLLQTHTTIGHDSGRFTFAPLQIRLERPSFESFNLYCTSSATSHMWLCESDVKWALHEQLYGRCLGSIADSALWRLNPYSFRSL